MAGLSVVFCFLFGDFSIGFGDRIDLQKEQELERLDDLENMK